MNGNKRRINVIPYSTDNAEEWNAFVRASRNATFLLERGYMDYHSDRFTDCSLIFRDDSGHILALLPACADGSTVHSHAGLTYGGLILPCSGCVDGCTVLEILNSACRYFRDNGFSILRYKAIPHIYHRYPAEEDIYALFRQGARQAEVNLSSTIALDEPLPFNQNSMRNMRHAAAAGVKAADDPAGFPEYWQLLSELLGERYGVRPVHTLAEIELLRNRFPDNIRLFTARDSLGGIVAGTLIFFTDTCAHAQYIAASARGKELRALPLLFDHIIKNHCGNRRYFDFGISNERHGEYLNEGLLRQKNGMGGRGTAYCIYEVSL